MVDMLTAQETRNFCSDCRRKRMELEARQQEALKMKRRLADSNIPDAFRTWDRTLGNTELGKAVWDFHRKSLYICGPNSTGKTRAAAYALLTLAKSGVRVRYERYTELAATYAMLCRTDMARALKYIRNALDYDVLLIDDIGKRRLTDTAAELLYELADRVYAGDTRARLWMTGNLTLTALAERFENADLGDAVISRFDRLARDGRMTIIEAGNREKRITP